MLLRRIVHNGVAKREITPFLSLIVPAYNESSTIVRKIHNSLALDYPPDRLEIVIACDGCKDGTPRLAEEAAQSPDALSGYEFWIFL